MTCEVRSFISYWARPLDQITGNQVRIALGYAARHHKYYNSVP